MANWRCPECAVVLDATDEGRREACPFCGLDMDRIEDIVDDEGPAQANIDTLPGQRRFSYRLRAVPPEKLEPPDDSSRGH